MHFTKRTIFIFSTLVAVAIVSAKLSLKPMERHPDGSVHVPSLQQKASDKLSLLPLQTLRERLFQKTDPELRAATNKALINANSI